MKVVAALSGGVDSAVAAARAVDAGHDVVGVHLALSRSPAANRVGSRGCCTIEDSHDARRVADVLGIPFYIWDLSELFETEVIDDFVSEYASGRTPNPCLRCNEKIKFTAVLDRSVAMGFDAVCTGHYARIVDTAHGRELHRALDPEKDQSYVLAVLNSEQLSRAMFPLGDTHKVQIRQEAAERGLLVADKPDSHDICFVPDGDTAGWLHGRLGAAPGEIVDAVTGESLGQHEGAYAFTVGQRRGVGLGRPAADGSRRYVVGVDTSTATVMVGPPTLLNVDHIQGDRLRWCGPGFVEPTRLSVQVRAHGEAVPGTVSVNDGTVTALLDEPLRGVAAGQALVMYDGSQVVGSATITRATRQTAAAI
jgi:tRNA-specific 2-thiouridylase